MNKTIKIIILVFAIFCWTSCDNKDSADPQISNSTLPPNPLEEQPESPIAETRKGFGYNISPVDYDFRYDTLTYDGNPIEISWKLYTESPDLEVGLLIFVDGAIQHHKVVKTTGPQDDENASELEQWMSVHTLVEGDEIEFTIQFIPNTGRKGDELSFNPLFIVQPSFLPQTANDSFGINHDGTPQDYGTVKFEQDAPVAIESPTFQGIYQVIEDRYKNVTDDNPTGRLIHPQIFLNDGTRDYIEKVILSDGKAKLRLLLGGGVDSDYRVTFFVNHAPVKIDGHESFLLRTKYDNWVIYEFELDLEGLPYLNSLYATIMPTGDGYILNPNGGHKTSSILLINPDAPDAQALETNPPGSDPADTHTPRIENFSLPEGAEDLSAWLLQNIDVTYGGVEHLFLIDNAKALISLHDKILVLDSNTGQKLDEINLDLQGEVFTIRFMDFDGGFSILVHEPITNGTNLYFYDNEINLTKTINPYALFASNGLRDISCTVSQSGLLLACPDDHISIVNVTGEPNIENISLKDSVGNDHLAITAIEFGGNDKYLVFVGYQTDELTTSTHLVYGIVDLEQKEVIVFNTKPNLKTHSVQANHDYALFTESLDAYTGLHGENKVILYDFAKREERIIPFSHVSYFFGPESNTVRMSPNSRFLIGYEYQKTTGLSYHYKLTLRVYDFESMAVVKEIVLNDVGSFKFAVTKDENELIILFTLENDKHVRMLKFQLD